MIERWNAVRRTFAPVELQLDGDGQPVLVGHERAGAVGEHLGQHRLDHAGHVDAVRAPERLAVDRRARLDVVRDVGDVHPDAHRAVVERLGGDRVVEVARGRRVDRERRQRAQVQPPGGLVLRRALGGRARLALDVRVEAAPQPAVEQHRLDHVAGDVRAADPAHDLRVARARPVRRDEHEVARRAAWPARGVDAHRPPAVEERLGRQEAPAPLEQRDDRAAGARSSGAPAPRGASRAVAQDHVDGLVERLVAAWSSGRRWP